jgi:hypothetical protein
MLPVPLGLGRSFLKKVISVRLEGWYVSMLNENYSFVDFDKRWRSLGNTRNINQQNASQNFGKLDNILDT